MSSTVTDLQPHPELAGHWVAPDGILLIDTDGDYVDLAPHQCDGTTCRILS